MPNPKAAECRRAGKAIRLLLERDLKPSGGYVMENLHGVGGTPAVIKYLLEKGPIVRLLLTGNRAARDETRIRRSQPVYSPPRVIAGGS